MTDSKRIVATRRAPARHWVGDGFPVHGMFDYNGAQVPARSPFLLLDYAAPCAFEPHTGYRRGVGQHPHRGFETVTVVYSGELAHRDNAGGGGTISPGDVQWMTAGGGIIPPVAEYFPLIQEIEKTVYGAGKGNLSDKTAIGTVNYNRGIVGGIMMVEIGRAHV